MTISVIMDTSTYQGRMNHYVFTIKKVWTSHMYPDSILHLSRNLLLVLIYARTMINANLK
jgi:hypothetical protein